MNNPTAAAPDVRESILANGQRIMAGKGFSAVGINEILSAAGVPKGSFYHYFGSKDTFGEALLEAYFKEYLADLDAVLGAPGLSVAQRLMNYFGHWRDTQSVFDCQGKCLAVKLGAEVSDLSESMRQSLKRGTTGIVERLARAIRAGVVETSLAVEGSPQIAAQNLYQLWLGASLMAKITRNVQPFDTAMAATLQILRPSP